MFKIKDGYTLELQTSETVILFETAKKLIDKRKEGESVQSRFEVVLVQYNLMKNQYKKLQSVKSYAYLLNVESSNLVFLKTYDTDFDEIIVTFTDQNGRLLEIQDKLNLT